MVIKFPGTPMRVKRTQAPTAKWSTSSGYSEKSGWRWSKLSVDVIPTVAFPADVSIINDRSVANAAVDQLEFIHNNTSSTMSFSFFIFISLCVVYRLEDRWLFVPRRSIVNTILVETKDPHKERKKGMLVFFNFKRRRNEIGREIPEGSVC